MLTFVHAADIHLDSPLRKLRQYEGAPVEAMRGATRRALENLVELTLDKKADFLLIAGDLYDGDWRDYNTGLFFISQMQKLAAADIPVFIVAGNHDAASRMTHGLRLPKGVRFLSTDRPETVRLDLLGVAIHGQGFYSPAVKKNLARAYPPALDGYFNIGLLHTGATGKEDHEPYAPCSLEDLLSKGYDYWALGHIHKREIMHTHPPVVFPGNIQGRHINETGPKGCMVAEADETGAVELTFAPLDRVRWERVSADISGQSDPYAVREMVCDRLEARLEESDGLPLIVRVELSGTAPVHERLAAQSEKWQNEIRAAALEIGGGRVWIEGLRLNSRPPESADCQAVDHGPLAEITALFDELRKDPGQLENLGDWLAPLEKKLPRELKEGADGLRPGDPEWLREVLDAAEPMLLRRLLSQEEKP